MKMKLVSLLLLASFFLAGITLKAQIQINPQIGINVTTLANLPNSVKSEGDVGTIIGSDFRFGSKLFLMPGVFYLGTKTKFAVDSLGGNYIQESDVNAPGVKLRLMGGLRIINTDVIGIRIAAGPSYTAFFNLEKTSTGSTVIKEDDFNNGTFNGEISLGFDIIKWLTLEFGYVYGFSDAIKTSPSNGLSESPKYRGVYLTAGINLGSGKK